MPCRQHKLHSCCCCHSCSFSCVTQPKPGACCFAHTAQQQHSAEASGSASAWLDVTPKLSRQRNPLRGPVWAKFGVAEADAVLDVSAGHLCICHRSTGMVCDCLPQLVGLPLCGQGEWISEICAGSSTNATVCPSVHHNNVLAWRPAGFTVASRCSGCAYPCLCCELIQTAAAVRTACCWAAAVDATCLPALASPAQLGPQLPRRMLVSSVCFA